MRRAVLGVAVAILLVGAGLMSPVEAVASKVQITRTSGPPVSGVPLALVVKVPNGLPGQKVWLERKVGKSWKPAAKRVLPASKQVTLGTALRLGVQKYRVHVFAKGSRKAAVRAFALGVRPQVKPAPYLDESFVLSGRLPLNGARPVKLQKRVGSSWSVVATKGANGSGVVSFAAAGILKASAYRFYAPKKGRAKAFTSAAVSVVPAERTQLVSRTKTGAPGNEQSSAPEVSGNGRYIVFESGANNLGPVDADGETDIYLRDLVTKSTTLVSRGFNGTTSNGSSTDASISYDGRYIAFSSSSSNLVANDANVAVGDIFRYDRVTATTKLISHDNANGPSNNGSVTPSISADGSRIAYASAATDLGTQTDNNNKSDVFLWSANGDQSVRLSKPADNATTGGGGANPVIAADGAWVGFTSQSDDIVAGSSTTAITNSFLRNVSAQTTALVSSSPCPGGGTNGFIGVTNGGTHVAFNSSCADVLPGDTHPYDDVFLRTMAGGNIVLVSHKLGGGFPDANSTDGFDMSPDGSRIVYSSDATNLVELDGNFETDVFLWVKATGTSTVISHRRESFEGFSSNGHNYTPSLSDGGKIVSWYSEATNVAAGDTTSGPDVYYRDLR